MKRATTATLLQGLFVASCLCLPVSWAASPDASRAVACEGSRRDMRAYASRETPADILKTAADPDSLATWCRRVRGDPRAEVCLSGPVGEAESGLRYRVRYQVDGVLRHAWDANADPQAFPDVFTADAVDLDGDGRRELFVGLMASESNGIGIQRWRLFALNAKGQPLGDVVVEDYGTLSWLFRLPGQRGCRLLASTWEYGAEPGRDEGSYVRGRWLRLSPQGWLPVKGVPDMRRRYLFSFERERIAARAPLRWFRKAVPCATPDACPTTGDY